MRKKIKLLFIQLGVLGNALKKPPVPPSHFFPLGLVGLISIVEEKFANKVEIKLSCLDTDFISWKQAAEEWKDFSPDLIGISGTFDFEIIAIKLVKLLRNLVPEAKIFIGGPICYGDPQRCLQKTLCDAAVYGEGEIIIEKLVESFLEKSDWHNISGLVWNDNGKIIKNDPAPIIENLDILPQMKWNYIKFDVYAKSVNMNNLPVVGKLYVPMLTSRGCPYDCNFCHNFFGKKIRTLSIEKVVGEMEYLFEKYGVDEFHIVDDAFNLIPDRIESLHKSLKKRGLNFKFSFPNGLRGDTITKKEISLLKECGTFSIAFSLESGSKQILKLMNKKLNLEKLLENVSYASKLDIFTSCNLIIGYPEETEEDIKQSFETAAKSDFDSIRIHRTTPYPGTKLYKQVLNNYPQFKNHLEETQNFKFDPVYNNINLTKISDERFDELIKWGTNYIFEQPHRIKRLDMIKNFFLSRGKNLIRGSWEYEPYRATNKISGVFIKKLKTTLEKKLNIPFNISSQGNISFNLPDGEFLEIKIEEKSCSSIVQYAENTDNYLIYINSDKPLHGLNSMTKSIYNTTIETIKELDYVTETI